MNIQLSFLKQPRSSIAGFFFYLLILLLPASAQAATIISVDHRVTLTSSEFLFDTKQFTYTAEVQITNHSATPILAPLRLIVSSIEGNRIQLINASAVGADGLPYIEYLLPQGELGAGMAATATVVFLRGEERDKAPAKKMKYKNNIPFDANYQVTGAVDQALLAPRASPYALMVNTGLQQVRFSVPLADKGAATAPVYLRQVSNGEFFPMNDQGAGGDLVAGDGIYGANVMVDTATQPGTCLLFESYTDSNGAEVVSPSTRLCISSFPVKVAESDTTQPVTLPDGSQAVADEVLVSVVPGTSEALIRDLAADINASVVGSIPPLNFYQLRLSTPVSSSHLLALLTQLSTRAEVKAASVNAIGTYAFVPSDTEFASQHGLKLVLEYDPLTVGVWDIGATGSGETVTVLDSGLDRSHPDFGVPGPGTCQLAENDCGAPSTDLLGHGTQVAGVVAAKTNNSLGVAGTAYGSKIHSIQVSPDDIIADTEQLQGFTNAAAYGVASVINASFRTNSAFGAWTQVCQAIDTAVLNGGVPVAVVVNAVGNEGLSGGAIYPARCNDLNAALTRKDLFITVANNASIIHADCGSVAVDQRCSTSNYGAWVDMAAPGSAIISTALGGGYVTQSGTSFSAPMVSGAVAVLHSCGVPLAEIENTLRTSANVTVPFPGGSSAPRLDIYRAMVARNRAPTAISLSGGSLSENTDTTAGVEAGTLLTTDPDSCDKLTYSIVGGADAAVFSIGGSGADRLRITAGVLDYETKSSYSVTVRVTDFGGQTFDQPLTMYVINLNEPPVIADQVFAINENSANLTPVGIPVASDPDVGDVLTYSITAGNTGGAFAINPVSGAISVSNTTALNFEATPIFTLTVQVTDAGLLSDTAAVTVNLNNVNEAPAVANQVFAINENSANGMAVGTAPGIDPDIGDTLSYSIIAGNSGGAFAINPVSGAISVSNTTALNFEATPVFSLTVWVTDAGMLSATATATINLNNLNEAPLIANQVFAINENSANGTAIGTVPGIDPDIGDTLSYSIIAGNSGGAFAINPVSGAISVNNTALLNFETTPVFSLTVWVTDAGMLSATATATINLNNLNEAPLIANQVFAINENSANGTAIGTVPGIDPDIGDTLSYSIIAGNSGGAFAINPVSGAITVNSSAALNFELTPVFTLTVRVMDAGLLTDTATVTVNLNDIVEPIPNPILVFDRKEVGTVDGNTFDYYHFTVSNWYDYPPAMFVGRPDLPPCGLNLSASRTWVYFYRNSDNSYIYGFCGLGIPANLNLIWFGVPTGTAPPAVVYIKLIDRETGIDYISNSVTVPFP